MLEGVTISKLIIKKKTKKKKTLRNIIFVGNKDVYRQGLNDLINKNIWKLGIWNAKKSGCKMGTSGAKCIEKMYNLVFRFTKIF